ncbi:MAG: hypothetical protein ABIL01_23995 [Pseudomonadota bacterium]
MSQISKAIFGVIAVSLTLGAVQFASGHDLAERWQAGAEAQTTGIASAINRSAKADRASVVAGARERTQTVSLRPESLSDTTVLVRIPVARSSGTSPETSARNGPAVRSLFRSGDRRKATVACEPMVSVLTEVAKQLQPGRCVT